jgi:SprT protein
MSPSEIISEVKKTVEHANQLFGIQMTTPEVNFIYRGTRGGRAYYYKNSVEFNAVLAEMNSDKFHNTIKHEIAHLVSYKLYGNIGKGHGNHFKSVFIKLGGDGKRTHSYDVSLVKQKYTCRRYEYSCKCHGKKFFLSQRKHNQISNNTKQWFCKTCKTLTFTGNVKEIVK